MKQNNRKPLRLRDYDYIQAGAYFVTICTHKRTCMFGSIVNGEMHLNAMGAMVQAVWDDLPLHYANIELDAFVIMPNHVHGIVVIDSAHRNRNKTDPQRQHVGIGRAGLKPAPTDSTKIDTHPQQPTNICRGRFQTCPGQSDETHPQRQHMDTGRAGFKPAPTDPTTTDTHPHNPNQTDLQQQPTDICRGRFQTCPGQSDETHPQRQCMDIGRAGLKPAPTDSTTISTYPHNPNGTHPNNPNETDPQQQPTGICRGRFQTCPSQLGETHLQRQYMDIGRAGLKPAPTGSMATDACPRPPTKTRADQSLVPKRRHGLSEIVRALKTFSARRINAWQGVQGVQVWQRNYYEHVIRSEKALNDIRRYIQTNPEKWDEDRENPSLLNQK